MRVLFVNVSVPAVTIAPDVVTVLFVMDMESYPPAAKVVEL